MQSVSAPPTEGPVYSSLYLRCALGMLMLVNALNVADRQIMGLLLEPIRGEFGLTDTQLGLLTGPAFGVFYVTLGIPIARFADRSSRRNVIATALALWSAFTALCGLAMSYAQLLAARVGVGVGEAGGTPPSHSLISDYFPAERRATALAVFGIGAPVGVFLGNAIGASVAASYGWRATFFVFGVPGLLLALLVRFLLREPVRGGVDGVAAQSERPALGAAIATLWRRRAFRYTMLAGASHAVVTQAYVSFMAAFFMRSHSLDLRELGLWLGIILGVAGSIGGLLGGYLSDRLGRRDARWYAWISGISLLVSLPSAFVMLLVGDARMALAMAGVSSICSALWQGPTYAIAQGVVTPGMRALTAAVMMFAFNLVGYGIGPLAVGMASDALQPEFGVHSLRYALLGLFCMNFVAAIFYALAAPHIAGDMRAAAAEATAKP